VTSVRPTVAADHPAIVDLALLAWAPVFASIEQALGPTVFGRTTPDWRAAQAAAVREALTDEAMTSWVAVVDDRVAGFATVVTHPNESTGEVHMIAVHPGFQRRGVARALMDAAVAHITASGMTVAMVATGGDPGHAAARALYEALGFTPLPLVQYYRAL
jgi:ribosomal protein S18 acetylase RimI-like enzyme